MSDYSDSHFSILIQNNTEDSIIMALKFSHQYNCMLAGPTIRAGGSYKLKTSSYPWENRLLNGVALDIYIVDPKKINTIGKYYDCDSIEVYNKVLKHYVLTLEDLNRMNFVVTYP